VDEAVVADVDADVRESPLQRVEEDEVAGAKILAADGDEPRGRCLLVGAPRQDETQARLEDVASEAAAVESGLGRRAAAPIANAEQVRGRDGEAGRMVVHPPQQAWLGRARGVVRGRRRCHGRRLREQALFGEQREHRVGGSIVGAINLGDGDDVYDGRNGTETGLLSGGSGADTETGGVAFDNLQGNQGNDSLSGGAGDDFVVGGKDDDVQLGDAGNDVVWGNLGNDTLDGGDGADQVRGGQGDDSVSGGAGNDFVSGDRGNDTVSGGAGADLFHGSQDAGIDRVLDFHLAEGDRVMLDPGTTYMVSQVGADTVIDMGGGNQMILVGVQSSTLTGGWIFTG